MILQISCFDPIDYPHIDKQHTNEQHTNKRKWVDKQTEQKEIKTTHESTVHSAIKQYNLNISDIVAYIDFNVPFGHSIILTMLNIVYIL